MAVIMSVFPSNTIKTHGRYSGSRRSVVRIDGKDSFQRSVVDKKKAIEQKNRFPADDC